MDPWHCRHMGACYKQLHAQHTHCFMLISFSPIKLLLREQDTCSLGHQSAASTHQEELRNGYVVGGERGLEGRKQFVFDEGAVLEVELGRECRCPILQR